MPGCAWWQHSLWSSMKSVRMALPPTPYRPMQHEAVCSGTMSECFGFQATRACLHKCFVVRSANGKLVPIDFLPFHSCEHFLWYSVRLSCIISAVHPHCIRQAMNMTTVTTAGCDKKPAAQKFVFRNHKVPHFYQSLNDMVSGNGFCVICQSHHGLEALPQPDLVTGGLPCQPFTKQRSHAGRTARTGKTRDHPDFTTVMEGFVDYMECRCPAGFLIEEVPEFANEKGGGPSYLSMFADRLSQLGYHIRALDLDHGVYCEMPRPRTPQ